ncbi:hypothetical protein [Streptomyces siamensis]|uniref:Nuclear transport factor 2 family protein n=1 Tax=Streptomyces siamensis TaxID=1274986 RepID=A0ABP9INT0_9ACTN
MAAGDGCCIGGAGARRGRGGLDVHGDGRGCTTSTGEFTVTRPARGDDGAVEAFAATFVQHCEGGAAALRGTIHYYA